jgi:hypothetical protein
MRHGIFGLALALALASPVSAVEMGIGLPTPVPGYTTRYLLTLDGVGKSTEVRSRIDSQHWYLAYWWEDIYEDGDWQVVHNNYFTWAECGQTPYGSLPCPDGNQLLKVNWGQQRDDDQVFINASIRRSSSFYFCDEIPVDQRPLYSSRHNACGFQWDPWWAGGSSWIVLDLKGPDATDFTWKVEVISTTPIPEPATWALMLSGFGALGVAVRHRNLRPA